MAAIYLLELGTCLGLAVLNQLASKHNLAWELVIFNLCQKFTKISLSGRIVELGIKVN